MEPRPRNSNSQPCGPDSHALPTWLGRPVGGCGAVEGSLCSLRCSAVYLFYLSQRPPVHVFYVSRIYRIQCFATQTRDEFFFKLEIAHIIKMFIITAASLVTNGVLHAAAITNAVFTVSKALLAHKVRFLPIIFRAQLCRRSRISRLPSRT